jgi:hypothetical protein
MSGMRRIPKSILRSHDRRLTISPWMEEANNLQDQSWRDQHELLIKIIQDTLNDTFSGIVASIGLGQNNFDIGHDESAAFERTEAALYADGVNADDRTARIDWLGKACVVFDRKSKAVGRGVAHVLAGRLFQSWVAAAWKNQSYPLWANPLLKDVFEIKHQYGENLTKLVALADMETFLRAHQRMINPKKPTSLGYTGNQWNKEALNACWALTLLAGQDTGRVPESLVKYAEKLRAYDDVHTEHQDIQKQIIAELERHLLTEFMDDIFCATVIKNQQAEETVETGICKKPRRL